MSYIELEHIAVGEGKERVKKVLQALNIPAYKPVLEEGRWRALPTKDYHPDKDMEWLVREVLAIPPELSDITTQRAIYYVLRGKYPDRKFRDNELGSDKFYGQLVSTGMEKVQLAAGLTMQSLGIWAAPKGYIAGDGKIYTSRRGGIPLTAQPTLNFDLADVGARLDSHARKIIHFEKDAGFANIVAGDMPKFIESVFSTAQGQLTEAANKFLRQAEDWGLQVYSVHDADAFGCQMTLLYGLASKNNCYMADEFFAKRVKSLGFFPSIAKLLNLPPEKIDADSAEFRLFGYLRQVAQEKPELEPEVETMISTMSKWEFQALNAIHEKAPQIYLVEGLRIKGDEIKYVPEGNVLKDRVIKEANSAVRDAVENAIKEATNTALEQVREEIEVTIRQALTDRINEFNQKAREMVNQLQQVPSNNYREQVKQELVNDPSIYWDLAIDRIARRSFELKFGVEAEVEVVAEVKEVEADITAKPTLPKEPEKELTKDDIVGAIEKKVLPRAPDRNKVVNPIRQAFEKVFGKPDQRW